MERDSMVCAHGWGRFVWEREAARGHLVVTPVERF